MPSWLMKTEPDAFSFADLVSSPERTAHWDGIRNYQARNMMRDSFQVGDRVFIYHSRIAEPAIVGTATVVRSAYPDHTALDPTEKYFDEKSAAKGESRWVMVDIKAEAEFAVPITLARMKSEEKLEGLQVIKRGQRLSIQPVSEEHWETICKLGKPQRI